MRYTLRLSGTRTWTRAPSGPVVLSEFRCLGPSVFCFGAGSLGPADPSRWRLLLCHLSGGGWGGEERNAVRDGSAPSAGLLNVLFRFSHVGVSVLLQVGVSHFSAEPMGLVSLIPLKQSFPRTLQRPLGEARFVP